MLHPQQPAAPILYSFVHGPAGASRTMRKAGGIIFLMALAVAMAAAGALPTPAAAAPRSLGRRSRFLAPPPMAGSCSAESPCPYSTDPNGYPTAVECCRGVCVDTATSVLNCGGCGYACGSWPWICCDGYCFNSQNDFENCGRCGIFCDGACVHGVCDYAA